MVTGRQDAGQACAGKDGVGCGSVLQHDLAARGDLGGDDDDRYGGVLQQV
jgi:hypothetical protein